MSNEGSVEKIISYLITLPSGMTLTINHDMGFTPEDFEWLENRFNVEDWVDKADLAQALCDDCESGVKYLNELAVERFKRDYPHLWKAINE